MWSTLVLRLSVVGTESFSRSRLPLKRSVAGTMFGRVEPVAIPEVGRCRSLSGAQAPVLEVCSSRRRDDTLLTTPLPVAGANRTSMASIKLPAQRGGRERSVGGATDTAACGRCDGADHGSKYGA